jgi:hypothetical protein
MTHTIARGRCTPSQWTVTVTARLRNSCASVLRCQYRDWGSTMRLNLSLSGDVLPKWWLWLLVVPRAYGTYATLSGYAGAGRLRLSART